MLKDWRQTPATRRLLARGPQAGSHLEFIVELCEWLCRRGMPLYQVNQYTPTLHPLMQGVECIWHRAPREPEEVQLHWRGGEDLRAWQANPLRRIMLGSDEIRVDLTALEPGLAAPILDRLRAEGASEYLVMAVPLADGRRNAISWATDAPGGFSLAERSELRNLAGPQRGGDRLGLGRHPSLQHHRPGPIDHAHRGLFQRHVQSGIVRHGCSPSLHLRHAMDSPSLESNHPITSCVRNLFVVIVNYSVQSIVIQLSEVNRRHCRHHVSMAKGRHTRKCRLRRPIH
jgi:hypothetical protein